MSDTKEITIYQFIDKAEATTLVCGDLYGQCLHVPPALLQVAELGLNEFAGI